MPGIRFFLYQARVSLQNDFQSPVGYICNASLWYRLCLFYTDQSNSRNTHQLDEVLILEMFLFVNKLLFHQRPLAPLSLDRKTQRLTSSTVPIPYTSSS